MRAMSDVFSRDGAKCLLGRRLKNALKCCVHSSAQDLLCPVSAAREWKRGLRVLIEDLKREDNSLSRGNKHWPTLLG